jgi:hypothetical protein
MITVLGTATTTVATSVNLTFSSGNDCILGISSLNSNSYDSPAVGPVTCDGVAMNLVGNYNRYFPPAPYPAWRNVWLYYLRNISAGVKTVATNLVGATGYLITAYSLSGISAGNIEQYGGNDLVSCNFTNADTNGAIVKVISDNTLTSISIITTGITQVMTFPAAGEVVVAASFQSTKPMGVMHFT